MLGRQEEERTSLLSEFSTDFHDLWLDPNLFYSRFNVPMRREGNAPLISCTVDIYVGKAGGGEDIITQ
jgi:hypothetical protein